MASEKEVTPPLPAFVPQRPTNFQQHQCRIERLIAEGLHDGKAWKPEAYARYNDIENQESIKAEQVSTQEPQASHVCRCGRGIFWDGVKWEHLFCRQAIPQPPGAASQSAVPPKPERAYLDDPETWRGINDMITTETEERRTSSMADLKQPDTQLGTCDEKGWHLGQRASVPHLPNRDCVNWKPAPSVPSEGVTPLQTEINCPRCGKLFNNVGPCPYCKAEGVTPLREDQVLSQIANEYIEAHDKGWMWAPWLNKQLVLARQTVASQATEIADRIIERNAMNKSHADLLTRTGIAYRELEKRAEESSAQLKDASSMVGKLARALVDSEKALNSVAHQSGWAREMQDYLRTLLSDPVVKEALGG